MKTVAEWRKAKGFSQDALARRAEVSRTTIKKLETDQVSQPRRDTLQRVADALGITLRQLQGQVPRSLQPALRKQRDEEHENLESHHRKDDPEVAAMEEWVRQGMLWRAHFSPPTAEIQRDEETREIDNTPTQSRNGFRANVVDLLSGDALDRETLEALLFLAASRYCLASLIDLSRRPHEYPGRALGMRQIIDDAECVAKLLFVEDFPPAEVHAWQIQRDTNEAQLREFRRAVERWEQTYAFALKKWAGVGPAWDRSLDRNLFLEACHTFDAFAQVLPAEDSAAIGQLLMEEHRSRTTANNGSDSNAS